MAQAQVTIPERSVITKFKGLRRGFFHWLEEALEAQPKVQYHLRIPPMQGLFSLIMEKNLHS